MAEISQVRQQVALARKYLSKGQIAKAKSCLKGLEHPKAQALLLQIENHAKQNPPAKVSLALLLGVGLIGLLLLLLVLGFIFFSRYQTDENLNLILPTLIPTADCSTENIQIWWDEQKLNLDSFLANASAASRTMPGERLSETLASIMSIRLEFDSLPRCADLEVQNQFNELLTAMDKLIAVLEHWSDGELDGTSLSNEFYVAEEAFRASQQALQQKLSERSGNGD